MDCCICGDEDWVRCDPGDDEDDIPPFAYCIYCDPLLTPSEP